MAVVVSAVLMSSACSYVTNSVAENMAQNLSWAVLNQDDPKTVQDGAPAYLLLIDGLIHDDPENVNLLLSGAKLYGSYASIFVADVERASRLSAKAREYGQRAFCRVRPNICGIDKEPYDRFIAALSQLTQSDVSVLYTYGVVWAGWVQTHQSDWNAVADLPKIEAAMRHVVRLDEAFDYGGAHFYLGLLSSIMPPALGGKPDQARSHFERAFDLSGQRNLMAQVMLAERYARIIFDRQLHDRILRNVLAADPRKPGFTLMNTLAQEQAHKLLGTADGYF
jgi:tetratricopeptide (TPR) repeat protein